MKQGFFFHISSFNQARLTQKQIRQNKCEASGTPHYQKEECPLPHESLKSGLLFCSAIDWLWVTTLRLRTPSRLARELEMGDLMRLTLRTIHSLLEAGGMYRSVLYAVDVSSNTLIAISSVYSCPQIRSAILSRCSFNAIICAVGSCYGAVLACSFFSSPFEQTQSVCFMSLVKSHNSPIRPSSCGFVPRFFFVQFLFFL